MRPTGADGAGVSRVLVTGMSGTGKSTVLRELARRGHDVIDTDDPGWIRRDGTEPRWDLDRMRDALGAHRTGWLFVGGCVTNQGALYDRFDHVVLLSAPVEVALDRVTRRTDNPYGSTARDRAAIRADLTAFEHRLRAGADHEIVTTVAVADVVADLERIAAGPRRPR